MKKVLIADDHSLFIQGISSLLKEHQFQVVGEVTSGSDVIYKVISLQPDIVILDLNMPKMNGLEVLKQIKDYQDKIIVIVLTMYNDEYLSSEVKRLGGNGYFLKNSDHHELIEAMNTLTQSGFYLTKSMETPARSDFMEDEFPTSVRLTKREREILKFLVEGKSSKDIGDILEISYSTVDTHRKNMLKKLSLNKISELVSYAHRNNLV